MATKEEVTRFKRRGYIDIEIGGITFTFNKTPAKILMMRWATSHGYSLDDLQNPKKMEELYKKEVFSLMERLLPKCAIEPKITLNEEDNDKIYLYDIDPEEMFKIFQSLFEGLDTVGREGTDLSDTFREDRLDSSSRASIEGVRNNSE